MLSAGVGRRLGGRRWWYLELELRTPTRVCGRSFQVFHKVEKF